MIGVTAQGPLRQFHRLQRQGSQALLHGGLTRQQAGPWWQGFHDPELDQLIEAVLAANPDMQVAGLRLRSALLGERPQDLVNPQVWKG